MATLISVQNHNFTAAAWGTVDATSRNASNAANTTLTTSYVASSTFTPGAITIDGIAVWVNTRLGATGTISVALDQAGATVAGTEVTINVTDIPSAGNCWVLFKFPAPVLLVAATLYSVKAKTSSATQVNLFSSSGTNWSRQLRTTTLAAPGAADVLYVIGERTGAGTGNNSTVTMDNTAATVFGSVNVDAYGTLAYGLTAATSYLLKTNANLNVRSGGEFNIGTVGGRMPADSVGELFFNNAANVDCGLNIFGSGIVRTGGNHVAVPWALLAADASAGATALTTDRVTGWKNGDIIGLASTSRSAADCESKALTADAVGTGLTIAATASIHLGGGATNGTDVVAELVNITRNVKIHGASGTLQAFIANQAATVVDFNDTEFYFMGSNTSGQRGISVRTSTGTFLASYCSFHDFTVNGSTPIHVDQTTCTNILIEHCVAYNNTGGGNPNAGFVESIITTVAGGCVINDCVGIRTTGGSSAMFYLGYNTAVTNIRIAGAAGEAVYLAGGGGSAINGIVTHSNASNNLRINDSGSAATIYNITTYRSNSNGVIYNGTTLRNITIDGLIAFGNNNNGVHLFSSSIFNVRIISGEIRAGLVATQATGITLENNGVVWYLSNCVLGGSGQPHATQDINIRNNGYVFLHMDYTILNSATQLGSMANLLPVYPPLFGIRASFFGQTVAHKSWLAMGTWTYDTVFKDGSAGASLRLTPSSATVKLPTPEFYAGALAGTALNVSIKVRKSVSGDGQAYNGNQPRFILRCNYGGGITSDIVLATSTAAGNGAFEELTATTPTITRDCALEFYVDCDGTTGWVNVDTFLPLVA